jgi:CDP-glucose 4,6-dehydratase
MGFALEPYTPEDAFVRTALGEKITDVRADILDLNKLVSIFHEFCPDIVFHLAAQPIVLTSYDLPIETFQVNVIGTANVLEAIRQTESVKSAVLITTDKVYQNLESCIGYRETDPMGGYDPYSASKVCSEIIIDSYRKSYFNSNQAGSVPNIASARAGNVLGGGDWQKDRIVPDCVRNLSTGNAIVIRKPAAVRPWQHVLDALGGYLVLGARLLGCENELGNCKYAEAWNFGPLPDSIISVKELVEKIINAWGSGEYSVKGVQKETKHESQILMLDISKAIFKLGWRPVLSIDECIALTIDWYKYALEHPSNDLYDFTKAQIDLYRQIGQDKNINWINA